jgi:hypothetical protein
MAYCLDEAPEPKWLRLARNVNIYGIEAVFGRTILHEYEMDAMRMSLYIRQAYRARSSTDDWAKWAKANPEAAQLLDNAMVEYKNGKYD